MKSTDMRTTLTIPEKDYEVIKTMARLEVRSIHKQIMHALLAKVDEWKDTSRYKAELKVVRAEKRREERLIEEVPNE